MRMSVPVSNKWVAKLGRSASTVTFLLHPAGRAALRVQDPDIDRLGRLTTREQPICGARNAPIAPQRTEQLAREQTKQSLTPLPWTTQSTIRPLSMSPPLRLIVSEGRRPAASAAVSAARTFRMGNTSKNQMASLASRTISSLRGSGE